MSKAELAPLREAGYGVWDASRGAARMAALQLSDGGLALYSPIKGPSAAFVASVVDIGQVNYLVAPNPYHHKGLSDHHAEFKNSRVVAPTPAIRRLERRTRMSLEALSPTHPKLAHDMEFHFPPGLKASEVWITFSSNSGPGLIVCDAFAGARSDDGAAKPVLRGAFRSLCLGKSDGERHDYRAFASRLFEQHRPSLLLPCHGQRVDDPDLWRRLGDLLEDI